MARTTKADAPADHDKAASAEAEMVAAESVTNDLKVAAEKRAAARAERDPKERERQEIDALLAERRGYVSRVAQVDKELERRGHKG